MHAGRLLADEQGARDLSIGGAGDREAEAWTFVMLADLEAWEQHHEEARAAIEQALRITHDLDVPLATAYACAIDEFVIGIGDTVAPDQPAPGAGNLEQPGSTDRYHFDGTTGQTLILDALTGSTNNVRWSLHAPDGSELFDAFYVDQQITLTTTGTHTITVHGLTITSTGSYSFQLLDVPNNTPPVALDDLAETDLDTAVAIDATANDFDADGDPVTIDGVSQPAHGTATIDQNRIFYTPHLGFTGTDSFAYSVGDGRGGSAMATIDVTVHRPPNTPPVLDGVADQVNLVGDTVDLRLAATDVDGDRLTFDATGLPPGLAIDPLTGVINGTIADGADAGSPYSVEISATDEQLAKSTGVFAWTVRPLPTATVPVAIDIVPSCIRNDGYGVIAVIIFGNPQAPVAEIDPATITLEGMPVVRILGHWLAIRADLDRDGVTDLLVIVDDVAGRLAPDAASATITAELDDGTRLAGTDTLCPPTRWRLCA